MFHIDLGLLNRIMSGKEEKKCVIDDCGQTGALICDQILKKHGRDALIRVELWVIANNNYTLRNIKYNISHEIAGKVEEKIKAGENFETICIGLKELCDDKKVLAEYYKCLTS
jgi:hypothetical protein